MSTKVKQNLKLTCLVTGKSRNTNTAYLEKKSEATASGSVEEFVDNYISRSAAKLLRQGKTVAETRQALEVSGIVPDLSDEQAQNALNLNGKRERKRVAVPA
tara:strand:+ start:226 stop:531 length:306 start_codon:yes stop_codon:yes gene_type:complete